MDNPLDAVTALKRELENLPKVPIEKAAEMLEVSLRTMYRRRKQFEWVRRRNHWYITVQSIRSYLEQKHYRPTPVFDVRKKLRQLRHSGQE